MAMGGGTFVVLGTTVVAVLAVGAAVGADLLVAEPLSQPLAGAASETSAASSDAFCDLVGEMLALAEERADASAAAEESLLANPAGFSEAEYLEALHAQGETKLTFIDAIVEDSERAADMVSDAAVADAFAVSARTGALIGTKMAKLALDAESAASYLEAVVAIEADPEVVRARAEGADANDVIDAYVSSECGVDFSGGADAGTGASAKADASTLGKEIATYFVDWDEGDPLPAVTLTNGEYYLRGVRVGTAADGAEIVDQYALSPMDWCISVSIDESPTATYNYSAQQGLIEGTCADLGDA